LFKPAAGVSITSSARLSGYAAIDGWEQEARTGTKLGERRPGPLPAASCTPCLPQTLITWLLAFPVLYRFRGYGTVMICHVSGFSCNDPRRRVGTRCAIKFNAAIRCKPVGIACF
jgi:hypothetical protein